MSASQPCTHSLLRAHFWLRTTTTWRTGVPDHKCNICITKLCGNGRERIRFQTVSVRLTRPVEPHPQITRGGMRHPNRPSTLHKLHNAFTRDPVAEVALCLRPEHWRRRGSHCSATAKNTQSQNGSGPMHTGVRALLVCADKIREYSPPPEHPTIHPIYSTPTHMHNTPLEAASTGYRNWRLVFH